MPKEIYEYEFVRLLDDSVIYLSPLKIKYLKEFMKKFDLTKQSNSEDDMVHKLMDSVLITMMQYKPDIKTIDQLEDVVNLPIMYKILDISAGIKINKEKEETVDQIKESSGASWEDMDLAKLESEAFLLGIWKNYEELEENISMPELVAILNQKRDEDYSNKKFFASLKGIDLDKESGKGNAWEELKKRAYAKAAEQKGMTVTDTNDITTFSGSKAAQAGFGIGMGISYQKV